eukprot:3725484-Amphidinium_carterae.1
MELSYSIRAIQTDATTSNWLDHTTGHGSPNFGPRGCFCRCPLPGRCKSAFRAELHAMFTAVRSTRAVSRMVRVSRIVSDCNGAHVSMLKWSFPSSDLLDQPRPSTRGTSLARSAMGERAYVDSTS